MHVDATRIREDEAGKRFLFIFNFTTVAREERGRFGRGGGRRRNSVERGLIWNGKRKGGEGEICVGGSE